MEIYRGYLLEGKIYLRFSSPKVDLSIYYVPNIEISVLFKYLEFEGPIMYKIINENKKFILGDKLIYNKIRCAYPIPGFIKIR